MSPKIDKALKVNSDSALISEYSSIQSFNI